jgi:hypothetical protein
MSAIPQISQRLFVVVTVSVLALLIGETAVLAAAQTRGGGPVRAVRVVTDDDSLFTVSSTWTNVPGMSVGVTIPSDEHALLLITFSAAIACQETSPNDTVAYCSLRVLVDGKQAAPLSIVAQAADNQTISPRELGSMQWAAGPLPSGRHTVTVQYMATNGAFNISARTLSVLQSRA